MARLTVYMPDDVHAKAVAADLNLSQLLTTTAAARLGEMASCTHPVTRCTACGAQVDQVGDEG